MSWDSTSLTIYWVRKEPGTCKHKVCPQLGHWNPAMLGAQPRGPDAIPAGARYVQPAQGNPPAAKLTETDRGQSPSGCPGHAWLGRGGRAVIRAVTVRLSPSAPGLCYRPQLWAGGWATGIIPATLTCTGPSWPLRPGSLLTHGQKWGFTGDRNTYLESGRIRGARFLNDRASSFIFELMNNNRVIKLYFF